MKDKEVRASKSVLFYDKDNYDEGSVGSSSDYQVTENSEVST